MEQEHMKQKEHTYISTGNKTLKITINVTATASVHGLYFIRDILIIIHNE
jgi:hypothetical protein